MQKIAYNIVDKKTMYKKGLSMDTKILFTEKEIKKAIDFARSIKWKHGCFSDKANKNIDNRTDAEVYVSILRGKLAEIALKKYLQEKHKDSKHKIAGLDFNIYKRGICDEFDLKFDRYTISIKSSKMFASCLFVEKDKYETDYFGNPISIEGHDGGIPDFYAFVKVKIDMNKINDSYAQICGAISHNDFWRMKKELPRGTYINKNNMDNLFINNKSVSELKDTSGTKLLATSYCLHLDLLRQI